MKTTPHQNAAAPAQPPAPTRPASAIPAPTSTQTYAAAYATLSAIAERLRTATGATTVDTLVDEVSNAVKMHKICLERLHLVRREIDSAIAAGEAEVAG